MTVSKNVLLMGEKQDKYADRDSRRKNEKQRNAQPFPFLVNIPVKSMCSTI